MPQTYEVCQLDVLTWWNYHFAFPDFLRSLLAETLTGFNVLAVVFGIVSVCFSWYLGGGPTSNVKRCIQ